MNLKPLILSVVLAASASSARAVSVQFDDRNVRPGDVVVPQGETHDGDLAAKGALTVAGKVKGDCASMGGALTISGECEGDAASFGGPVAVSGKVGGDLASFGGPVGISGRILGKLSSFGGDILLRSSATINGGVTVVGGKLRQDPGAVVRGEIHDMESKILGALGPALAKAVSKAEFDIDDESDDYGSQWSGDRRLRRAVRKNGPTGLLLALCLLPALAALFAPEKVEAVGRAGAEDFWRSAGIGLLIAIAIAPAMLGLTVSVIGIPFIPVVLLALAAAAVLGLAAFFRTLSRRAWRNLGRPEPGTIPAVALGAAVVFLAGAVLGFIPGIGGFLSLTLSLVLCAAATVGLGACWTTRLGTKPLASN